MLYIGSAQISDILVHIRLRVQVKKCLLVVEHWYSLQADSRNSHYLSRRSPSEKVEAGVWIGFENEGADRRGCTGMRCFVDSRTDKACFALYGVLVESRAISTEMVYVYFG